MLNISELTESVTWVIPSCPKAVIIYLPTLKYLQKPIFMLQTWKRKEVGLIIVLLIFRNDEVFVHAEFRPHRSEI